jgi:hypothetical protein
VLVKFVKPTDEMVMFIAENMRHADVREVWEMSRQTPLESIEEGLELSNYSAVAVINDIPCAVFGLTIVDMLTGTGVPWLLGTDYLVKHRSVFLKNGKQGLDQMLKVCPNLFNYVHAENKTSVRWLKYMGFKVEDATPIGVDGALFHRFSIGDCSNV